MTIQEKLAILREKMKENNMDIYMIPTADFHQSEYVGEYFKSRSYMSGFTGSAGTLVVTLTEAGLWTDGRYFIQAEQQLAGSTITLYRMSEEGVPTVKEFVEDNFHRAVRSDLTEEFFPAQMEQHMRKLLRKSREVCSLQKIW